MKAATFENVRRSTNLATKMAEFNKRAFDIAASALGLLFLSHLFLLVAVLIKRSSPGPVYYRGTRLGKDGKPFQILKFRTMYETPESYSGARITAHDDLRVTPLGRWLRDTKLNELPQLWNVLKGEMSLVGPRPEDPAVADTWPTGAREEILSVRPGITSPASIIYRDEEKLLQASAVMDRYLQGIMPSKLRLDQLYVRNRSFLGDLDVIFLTLLALLPNIRKQHFPEPLLFWGPLARFLSRHLNWFTIDALTSFLAVSAAGALWRASGPLNLGWQIVTPMSLGISLFFGIANAALGISRISWSQARPIDALRLVTSGALTTSVLILLNRLIQPWPDLPLGLWALINGLAILGFLITRYRLRLITGVANLWVKWRSRASEIGERVLVIGAGEMAQFAIQLLHSHKASQWLHIVGFVDDDPKKYDLQIGGYNVLGTIKDIPELVEKRRIGLLLLAIGDPGTENAKEIIRLCQQSGARLVHIPNLYNFFTDCLLETSRNNSDLLDPDCKGSVPIQTVANWIVDVETLAYPDNVPLKARLREIRNELTSHVHRESNHD